MPTLLGIVLLLKNQITYIGISKCSGSAYKSQHAQ